jgi:hypothetical protein
MKTAIRAMLFALAAPFSFAAAQEQPPIITPAQELTLLARDYSQADLDRMGRAAFEAVISVAPTKLKSVGFRFVEISEMRDVLREELLPQMLVQVEDKESAESSARTTADVMANAVIAKFATGTGEVLVVRDNLFELAGLLKMEELASKEVMDAVLCHEVAHALDNHHHPFRRLFATVKDTNGLHAMNALIEGHAQFVARRACAKVGNLRGFKLFTSSIDFLPETEDAGAEYMGRIAVAQFSFAYKDGERFIAALVKAKGAGVIKQVFDAPPEDSILISEPSWYLDPTLRPEQPYDFERTLGRFESTLDKQTPDFWTMTKVELLGPQISAAFSVLPKERYEEAVKDILECRVLIAQNPRGDGAMISAGLFALPTGPKAEYILELELAMIEAKRAQLPNGVRIEDSLVEELLLTDTAQFEGVWVDQIILVGDKEITNFAVLGRRGQAVVELNFIGFPISRKDAVSMAEQLLQAPAGKVKGEVEIGDSDKPDDAK